MHLVTLKQSASAARGFQRTVHLHITCPCIPVVKALGRHAQYSVTRSGAGVQTSARARPHTKELFQIIPTHMMNRKVIPGRKKGFRRCPP